VGQRALACASVENSFAAAGLAETPGARSAVGGGGGPGLDGAAGAAVGAGGAAGGGVGAAVVGAGAAPPRH